MRRAYGLAGVPAQLHIAVEEAQAAAGDAELIRNGLRTMGGITQLLQDLGMRSKIREFLRQALRLWPKHLY